MWVNVFEIEGDKKLSQTFDQTAYLQYMLMINKLGQWIDMK